MSKQTASRLQSKYIRLKSALEYCERMGIDTSQFNRPEDIIGVCCTCGTVKSWIRMDMGHCIGRGVGGSSGVYFDERNVALQCKRCNAFKQGARPEFEAYLIKKYGDGIMEELARKHRVNSYSAVDCAVLEMHYKKEYKRLLECV